MHYKQEKSTLNYARKNSEISIENNNKNYL